MRGADALALDMRELATSAIYRLQEERERQGLRLLPSQAAATPAVLQDELDSITSAILDRIERLPENAAREAAREYEKLRARMRVEVLAAFSRRVDSRLAQRLTNSWFAELRALEVRLDRLRNTLAADAARAGIELGSAAARVLDLKIRPPRMDVWTDARGIFGGLTEHYGPRIAKYIADTIDRVQAGASDVRGAQVALTKKLAPIYGIRILNKMDAPEYLAVRIMRTEVGRVSQEAHQEELQRVGKRVQGVMKEWRSLLDPIRSRPGHIEAHGQRIGVDDYYLVRPKRRGPFERLMHPKDIRGSAGNVINCFCSSVPRLDDVSVRPSSLIA